MDQIRFLEGLIQEPPSEEMILDDPDDSGVFVSCKEIRAREKLKFFQ